MNFKENLKKYRQLAGFKQAKDFANELGIKYSTYAAYENLGRQPNFELLCLIAHKLNVTTDDLIGFNSFSIESDKSFWQEKGFEIIDCQDHIELIFPLDQTENNDGIVKISVARKILKLADKTSLHLLTEKVRNELQILTKKFLKNTSIELASRYFTEAPKKQQSFYVEKYFDTERVIR